MKICEFTMPEIRHLLAECNFTELENLLFIMRASDIPLEDCAEKLDVSVATANRIHKNVKSKIERVLGA